MPLREGLPVRTPSCSRGPSKVFSDQLSPTSEALLDLPQTSSSRPHRFSSAKDSGDRSLPSGHNMGELVNKRPWTKIPKWQEGFWVPSRTPTHRTPSQPLFRRSKVAKARLTLFHPLEEMGKMGPDTPILVPCGNLPSCGGGRGEIDSLLEGKDLSHVVLSGPGFRGREGLPRLWRGIWTFFGFILEVKGGAENPPLPLNVTSAIQCRTYYPIAFY